MVIKSSSQLIMREEVDTLSPHSEDQFRQSEPSSSPPTADSADINDNKWIGILAYIIFFLPLIAAKHSRFAMYHGNQGLLVLLLAIACNIVLGLIPIIGWILLPIANLATLALTIIGIIQAAKGQLNPLPIIGNITIIKTP
jgi:uncharacterized membrane protein